MSAMSSQINSLTVVYSIVYLSADQRKHQSSALLAFVRGIHRWPVNPPHKGPVTRKKVSIWWRHHAKRTVPNDCYLVVQSTFILSEHYHPQTITTYQKAHIFALHVLHVVFMILILYLNLDTTTPVGECHYRFAPTCTQGGSLQWRHNGRDGVSNHQPHHCLLKRLFWRRSKKTSKLRVTGLCEFPAQGVSNAENVSIWWRHHAHKMKVTT